jgi:hypothetical protein
MSNQKWVTLPGVLQNEDGDQIDCVVSALERSLGSATVAYARASIQSTSKLVKDGRHRLAFGGKIIPIERRDGQWLSLS